MTRPSGESTRDAATLLTAKSLVTTRSPRLVDAVVAQLGRLGVRHAFGCTGGTIAVFCEALARSDITVVQCRHESGAAFAAAEAYFASGAPAAVFTTSGPSIMNALNGLMAARSEGAKVILISGSTPTRHRGRAAFQETSALTMPRSIFAKGSIFDYAIDLQDPEDLPIVLAKLEEGVASPGGFVAHVALPSSVQASPLAAWRVVPQSLVPSGIRPADVDELATLLTKEPFGVWVGFGARNCSAAVRRFAEKSCAPVVATPRGRGVFPEDHPLFLGVTGLASPWDTGSRLKAAGLKRLLVLGSRLGELSSMWDQSIIPPGGLVQIDIDPDVPRVFPDVPRRMVRADIGDFLEAITPNLRGRPLVRIPPPPPSPVPPLRGGRVRPQVLMALFQRIMVDAGVRVLVDCGNSFAWANACLRFTRPDYRVSLDWGSMGQAVAGVVGAAMATADRCVALVGDGAMLMQSEISTAVKYQVPAIWIVLNDAQYGMIEQGMRAGHLEPVETQIPPVDFVAMAMSVGAAGVRVAQESDVEAALVQALHARGPYVVDVMIDRDELAPIGKRVATLEKQGVGRTADE